MDDVITDIPPPSRFLLEDLNNFSPRDPVLPTPFLDLYAADAKQTLSPSILIIAMSSSCIHILQHLSPKTPLGTLVLPDALSGENKSCDIYALNSSDKLIMLVLVQFPISPERTHAVAKLLIRDKINPQKVLILDSIQSRNFRGKLLHDEVTTFKLETSVERKNADAGDCLLKRVNYFPSGSVVDGLSAALLTHCELKKIRGSLFLSWPEFGIPVISTIKFILEKDVLNGVEFTIDGDHEEYLKLSRRKQSRCSDLYA